MSSTPSDRDRLADVIRQVRQMILEIRERKRSINEASTRQSLIVPVLAGLGWDVTNPFEVQPEYTHGGKYNPVDWALFVKDRPRLFIEAKPLGAKLDDPKVEIQLFAYAAAVGLQWCVLTDGDAYRFYNTHAVVDAREKLFRSVEISKSGEHEYAVESLAFISKDQVACGAMDDAWRAQEAERAVEGALRSLVADADERLVQAASAGRRHIRPEDIEDALRRAEVRLSFSPPQVLTRRNEGSADRRTSIAGKTADRDAGWGLDGYVGPVTLDGSAVSMSKSRPFAGDLAEKRVALSTVAAVATAALDLSRNGRVVTAAAVKAHPQGPRSFGPIQTALAALLASGALVCDDGDGLWAPQDVASPDEMVDRLLTSARRLVNDPPPQNSGEVAGRRTFKWEASIGDGGAFSITCTYIPDPNVHFEFSGVKIPPAQDFRPAREELLRQIYEAIRPLFPGLKDGLVRAKAWSGVHRIYPAKEYGGK